MAVNEVHIDAGPAQVFGYLSDGRKYAEWVVGAKRIRAVDEGWPAVGSRIHHTVGAGPLTLDDHTEVLEVEPTTLLVLDARARPIGRARVELRLEEDGTGTKVVMRETVASVSPRLGRLFDPLIHLRNVEALRRLRENVETPSRTVPGR